MSACAPAYQLYFSLLRCTCPSRCVFQETLNALQDYGGSLLAAGLLWLLIMYLFALIGQAEYVTTIPASFLLAVGVMRLLLFETGVFV